MAPSVFFLLCSGRRQQSLLSFMQCVHDVSLCCCIGSIEGIACICYIGKLRKECRLRACYTGRAEDTGIVERSI